MMQLCDAKRDSPCVFALEREVERKRERNLKIEIIIEEQGKIELK